MRHTSRVDLQKAILHLVGDGDQRACTLSQDELTLDEHGRHFVQLHVLRSLRHERSWSARFGDRADVVCAASQALFASNNGFIEQSGRIAQKLSGIVCQDQRITPGALLVAMFRAISEIEGQSPIDCIGILKLTASDGFTTRTEHRNGRTRVVLQRVEQVVPSNREELHKCAFIPRPEQRRANMIYDLAVVDWQRRGDPEPAEFFLRDFLGAVRAADPKQLTIVFNREMHKALNQGLRQGLITSDERNDLILHVKTALTSNNINVPRFIEQLPITRDMRNLIGGRLGELMDHDFAPDPEASRELTKTIRYRGDADLMIAVPAQNRENMIQEEEDENAELGRHHKITIRTKKWHVEK